MKLPQSVLNKIFEKLYKEEERTFQDNQIYITFIIGCLKSSCEYLDQKIKELDTYNIAITMLDQFLIIKTNIKENNEPQFVLSFNNMTINQKTHIIQFTKDIEYRKYLIDHFHKKVGYIFIDYENNFLESIISTVFSYSFEYIKEFTENNKNIQEIEFSNNCKLSLINYPYYQITFLK